MEAVRHPINDLLKKCGIKVSQIYSLKGFYISSGTVILELGHSKFSPLENWNLKFYIQGWLKNQNKKDIFLIYDSDFKNKEIETQFLVSSKDDDIFLHNFYASQDQVLLLFKDSSVILTFYLGRTYFTIEKKDAI